MCIVSVCYNIKKYRIYKKIKNNLKRTSNEKLLGVVLEGRERVRLLEIV